MDSRRGAHHPVMGGSRHWPSIDANYEHNGGSKAPAVRKQSQSPTNLVAAQSSAGVQSLQRLHRFSQQGTWPVPVGFSGELIELGPESRNTAAAANSDIGLGLSSLSEEGAIVNHPGHLQQSTECHASSGRMRGHSVSSSSSSNSPPDFLSGRVPIQGSSKGEFTTCTGEFFFPCRLGGHDVTENYGGPPTPPQMSGLPTLGSSSKRESQASESVVYPADGNAIDERKRAADGGRNRTVSYHFTDGHHVQDVGRKMNGRGIKDAGRGSMNSNSLNIKQRDHLRTDTQLFGSSSTSHHSARVDASSSRANSGQGLVDPEAGCSSSSSEGLHSDVDHHLLRRGSSISGRMLENVTGGVFGKLRSSSYRSSACKRKSCTSSSVSGSLSCGSHGSLRNGFRESNGGRTAARIHNGMSRRTMGIGGCTSASDVVVSTSSAQAAAAGRSSGLPGVPSGLEEPVARRSTSLREALHSMPDTPHRGSRSGKSAALASSSAGKSSQTKPQGRGVGLLLAEAAAATLPSRTSFAQTLRRSVPMMQHENSGSQRTVLSDCHMNPNDRSSSSSSSSLVPNEILTASSTSTHCQSGSSSLVGGSRSGTSFSPRHRDTSSLGFSGGGERLSHRYLGRSRTHSVTTSVSSASQLGAAVATESSRLRNQELFSFNNLESMSLGAPALTESVPPAMQSTSTTAAAPSSRVPHTPCSQRQGNSVHTVLTNNPAISAPGPSPLSPSPPPPPSSSLSPSSSLLAPFVIDSLSSPTSHFQRSLLSRTLSPGGVQESQGFSSAATDSLLGMPFRGLQLSARNGTRPPHVVSEGLAEIISALEHVERDEDLTYEQLLMLEATLLFGGLRLRDQHSDLRLDVDNMSYEELLALEDRIGNVSTGLTAEAVAEKLKRSCYSSLDVVGAQFSQEYDTKCSICQEEYEDGDKLGKIECGHSYHALCIQQWLVQKNQCPICKATAFAH
jgi:hypothetical protein